MTDKVPRFAYGLRLPEIYDKAGQRGNLVLAAPTPFNINWGMTPVQAPPAAPPPVKAR